jgi:hypothetical protein
MTELQTIYNAFTSKITEDMYLELTKEETENLIFEIF